MEWVGRLRGTVVGIDTAPFIYFIEENAVYLPLLEPFFRDLDRGEFTAVTSTLTHISTFIPPLSADVPTPRFRVGHQQGTNPARARTAARNSVHHSESACTRICAPRKPARLH
jgi:hypothetical protein